MMQDGQAGAGRRAVMIGSGASLLGGTLSPRATLAQATSPSAAPPPDSSALAASAVELGSAAILRISREVWASPELSLQEMKGAAIHLRELEAAGFRVVSRGTSGVPTAFIAEWSQGRGPALGYLPEYDALPGLGNAAEPRRNSGAAATAVGHGCGHNMLGAGCTGGAIALKRMMEQSATPGTVRVYGCAAEEMEGAKVYMARDGLFDDLDAALAWHPAPFAVAGTVRLAAIDKAKVAFHGRSAHAGFAPWEGRSALKAAELFGVGVQMMREHILPSARIHYVYEHAGTAPNVIPDFAQIWIVMRDLDRDKVDALTAWVRQVTEGAATATQTSAEFTLFFGTHDLLPNEPLARHAYRHIQAVPLRWTAEEQDFARACQREMGLPEAGMATAPVAFAENVSTSGSSDLGCVSYQVPLCVFGWPTLPIGIGLHTWPVTACGGMSIGDKASLDTAKILAAIGYDLMRDGALREAAKADFRARRGDAPFRSPLPPEQRQPLNLPPQLVKTGDDEVFAALQPRG